MSSALYGVIASQGEAGPPAPDFLRIVQVGIWVPYLIDAHPHTVPWDYAQYDQDDCFNPANPTRITMPAGVTEVRLKAKWRIGGNTTTEIGRFLSFQKNGVGLFGAPVMSLRRVNTSPANTGSNHFALESAWLPATEGDYFELRVNTNNTLEIHRETDTRHAFMEVEYY